MCDDNDYMESEKQIQVELDAEAREIEAIDREYNEYQRKEWEEYNKL